MTPVAVPAASLASSRFGPVDYSDAFRVGLERTDVSAAELAQAFLLRPPRWVVALLGLRNLLMWPFGLAVSVAPEARRLKTRLVGGDAVAFMTVFAIAGDEVVLGRDDRHLSFRVVVQLERGGGSAATLSTFVRFNNALGRAYFVPVGFVHRWVVPAMLRRAAEWLAEGGPAAPQASGSSS